MEELLGLGRGRGRGRGDGEMVCVCVGGCELQRFIRDWGGIARVKAKKGRPMLQ